MSNLKTYVINDVKQKKTLLLISDRDIEEEELVQAIKRVGEEQGKQPSIEEASKLVAKDLGVDILVVTDVYNRSFYPALAQAEIAKSP